MKLVTVSPKKSLNKAFLKQRPLRADMDLFKENLISLLGKIDEIEREENQKNHVRDFLLNTYYKNTNEVNTKGTQDLVIHNGKDNKTSVGVIIEAKRPNNKAEWISAEKPNGKALQELVLYYLRERIDENNIDLKYLVATNINEWYVFEASYFEKTFFQNKKFVKEYEQWRDGQKVTKDTKLFYNDIAKPFIDSLETDVECAFFNIKDYEKALKNESLEDDKELIALFKLLSPNHLLKLPFANDSNSLNKVFYSELLHIIGLAEVKDGGKKLIQRPSEKDRLVGSLLENTITVLDSHDKISRLKNPKAYGETYSEQLYQVALELVITWMNRILFLKLLEGQLYKYNKQNNDFLFLNSEKIKDFDDLDKLFFRVLAKKVQDRDERINKLFGNVPYLNSSLFEPTELEHETVFASGLEDFVDLPFHNQTVLKDTQGKKRNEAQPTLDYLFLFLDAYDFGAEDTAEIQENSKTIINASVLGLIFEKINGYKDGSFFTPGFITMYMCRETIRRAVVQKFKEVTDAFAPSEGIGSIGIKTIDDVYELIGDKITKQQANEIINSIKICDPAVGSGHFLVSALNELIALKSELKILLDKEGKTLRDYQIEVVNDELLVTDDDGNLVEYNPNNKESQRVQETLFHEKQTLIENCLFGVDINPNSVKICRLRLWIELLKNAYYRNEPMPSLEAKASVMTRQLETLPNIDINIKCGNSLISRFGLDADIKQALKKSKWTIESYKLAVSTYRDAKSKEEKREMERLIADIKGDFRTEISKNDKKVLDLHRLSGELVKLTTQTSLFEQSEKEKAAWNKKIEKLTTEIQKLEAEIEEIKNNKIYENAFEWRFEFPEVLNNDGDFVGFDVVIGNPPYGVQFDNKEKIFIRNNYNSYQYKYDSYIYFIEKGIDLLKTNGIIEFIVPILWLTLDNCQPIRKIVTGDNDLNRILIHGEDVFEEAVVNTCSFQVSKVLPTSTFRIINKDLNFEAEKDIWIDKTSFQIEYRLSPTLKIIIDKIRLKSKKLLELGEVIQGLTPYDSYSGQSKEIIQNRAYHFNYKKDETCGKWLDGKNLNRYSISWDNTWLSYGNWIAAPREKRFFQGQRILFREVSGQGKKIQASLTDEEFYYGHSISPFKPFDKHIKDIYYILGIVNSNLVSWFGRYTLANFGKDIFPKLNPNDIKELPIPENFVNYDAITMLVTKILNDRNSSINTSALEKEIDQLVYELYGLTEEEIKIVEGV